MANILDSVKGLVPRRNNFKTLTYRNDFTMRMANLVPCYLEQFVPGTAVRLRASALLRLQALIAPVMDNMYFYCHFWKIPWRLLSDGEFTDMVTGTLLEEGVEPDMPYITPGLSMRLLLYNLGSRGYSVLEWNNGVANMFGNRSVFDMLGYDLTYFQLAPETIGTAEFETAYNELNVYKVQAYAIQLYVMLVYHRYINEYVPPFETALTIGGQTEISFKDLSLAIIEGRGNIDDLVARWFASMYFFMNEKGCYFNHAWFMDYFTAGLPDVQAGDPIRLSLAESAPVEIPAQSAGLRGFLPNGLEATASAGSMSPGDEESIFYNAGDPVTAGTLGMANARANLTMINGRIVDPNSTSFEHTALEGVADLSEATAISINELRVANALQVYKERTMRYGHRAQDYYFGFFHVTPRDLRLQLPAYLGGGKVAINISDIEQTSSTDSTSPQGNLAGKGTGLGHRFAGFTTFCDEESHIIGLCWSMPSRVAYAHTISRHYLKLNDRYEYFNPSFEHLGEQEIRKQEVYAGDSEGWNDTFAYQVRFAEYRVHMNEVHGDFKDSLSFWTLARLDNDPSFNAQFLYMQSSDFDRIFAVAGSTQLQVSMYFDVSVVTPISRYGTPGLMV